MRVCTIALLAIVASTSATAQDLELVIRTYPREILIGDPLYVEVTITNHGKSAVSFLPPVREFGTLRFEIYDVDRNLIVRDGAGGAGFVGGASRVSYEPGKPVRHYWCVFVPGLKQLSHSFWSAEWGRLRIFAVYRLSGERLSASGLELRSQLAEVVVHSRDAEELRFLDRWAWAATGDPAPGPLATGLGLQLNAVTPAQTMQIAQGVQPGELADLLELTGKLQRLCHGPPELLDAGTRELADWLSKQPDIKRQALLQKSILVARSYLPLFPTAKVLEEIANQPR